MQAPVRPHAAAHAKAGLRRDVRSSLMWRSGTSSIRRATETVRARVGCRSLDAYHVHATGARSEASCDAALRSRKRVFGVRAAVRRAATWLEAPRESSGAGAVGGAEPRLSRRPLVDRVESEQLVEGILALHEHVAGKSFKRRSDEACTREVACRIRERCAWMPVCQRVGGEIGSPCSVATREPEPAVSHKGKEARAVCEACSLQTGVGL
eukprot:6173240-Pleurochrysis_carterae.AAC.8